VRIKASTSLYTSVQSYSYTGSEHNVAYCLTHLLVRLTSAVFRKLSRVVILVQLITQDDDNLRRHRLQPYFTTSGAQTLSESVGSRCRGTVPPPPIEARAKTR